MHMMRTLKLAVATNFVLSALAVLALTLYALFDRQQISEQWMGMIAEIGAPIWVDILFVQAILLFVFCMRRRTEEWKVRLLVAGIGGCGLLFSLGLPLVLGGVPDLLLAPAWSADRAVWWYACISAVAYGLVGTATPESERRKELDRFAAFSNRLTSGSTSPEHKAMDERPSD